MSSADNGYDMDGTGRGTPIIPATFRKATRAHSADDAERWEEDAVTGTLNGWEERHDPPANVVADAAVRRLTPTECERLQGFPDGWTAGESDSARYRMLGNAVCMPVAEWIGRRIMAVERAGRIEDAA